MTEADPPKKCSTEEIDEDTEEDTDDDIDEDIEEDTDDDIEEDIEEDTEEDTDEDIEEDVEEDIEEFIENRLEPLMKYFQSLTKFFAITKYKADRDSTDLHRNKVESSKQKIREFCLKAENLASSEDKN
jgi:hypothetical protein